MTDKLDLAGFHFSLLRCFPSVVVLSRPGPSKKRNYQAYLFICHEKVLTRPGPSKKRNYQAYLFICHEKVLTRPGPNKEKLSGIFGSFVFCIHRVCLVV